jgi:hypothetical protein
MRALGGRAILLVALSALVLAAWRRDPLLAACVACLALGAFEALRARHPRRLAFVAAMDSVALGAFAWMAALVVVAMLIGAWVTPERPHPQAQRGAALAAGLVFALLRIGRRDAMAGDAIVLIAVMVACAAPIEHWTQACVTAASTAAAYLGWRGWRRIGPKAGALLGHGRSRP